MNFPRILLLPVLIISFYCMLLSAVRADEVEIVGTLPVQVSVDNKGAANATVPLLIPPGRGGMQPRLAVSYNSQSGIGLMGMGFSLSTGFPQSISRGRSILARDGVVRGVNFDTDDKFYLDGKRLICVSGVYGQIGSTYRTEVDSFMEITALGSAGNIEGFRVIAKDGTSFFFGENVTDRSGAFVYAAAPSFSPALKALEWKLRWVEDVTGNYVELIYNKSPYVAQGEQLLQTIRYTGNRRLGIAPLVTLSFWNAPRPDYVYASYEVGRKREMVYCLSSISISGPGSESPAVSRAYIFEYIDDFLHGDTSTKPGALRLNNITYRESSGAEVRQTKTVFEWGADSVLPPAPAVFNHSTNKLYSASLTGDFNGDGRNDILLRDPVTHQAFITYNNAFDVLAPTIVPFGPFAFPFVESVGFQTGDFNGDGKTDLIWYGNSASSVTGWYVSLSTGTSFGPPILVYAQPPNISDGQGVVSQNIKNGLVGDFNGDGMDDFLILSHLTRTVTYADQLWVVTGQTQQNAFAWVDPDTDEEHHKLYDTVGAGGGVTVAAAMPGARWYLMHSVLSGQNLTFSGGQIPNPTNLPVTPEPVMTIEVANLDNDGKADLIATALTFPMQNVSSSQNVSAAGGEIRLYALKNIGSGNFVRMDTGIFNEMPATLADQNNFRDLTGFHKMMGDVNGDGLPDIIYLKMSYTYSSIHGSGMYPTGWVEYIPSGDWHVALSKGNGEFDHQTFWGFPAFLPVGEETVRTFNRRDGYYIFAPDEIQGGPGYPEIYDLTGQTGLEVWGVHLFDYNGDGKKDFVFCTPGKGWFCLLAFSDGFDYEHPIALPWVASDPPNLPWRSQSLDFDGNGRDDLVFLGPTLASDSGAVNETLWWHKSSVIYTSLTPSTDAYRVIGVTDGFGAATEISYAPSTSDSVYTPGAPTSYPIQEVRRPQMVVAELYKDSGSGIASDRAHFSYQYSGRRVDLSGRGDLGFHAFVTLDHQTNVFKYQFLTQSFPMTGLTAREQTYRFWESGSGTSAEVNFRLISSHDNTVVFDEVVNGADMEQAYGTVYPFMSKAVESRWENSPSAHFTLSKGADASSKAKDLFTKALPQGAHITISAQSWFDEQPLSTSPPTTLPGPYNASDRTTDWSLEGENAVTGIANYQTFDDLPFSGHITYGNLRQLSTDFGDGFTEKVETTYHDPTANGLTGLVDTITTTVSSTTHGTEAAPIKSFTYETIGEIYTPLVKTETIDATEDELDLETIYTRDTLGRVTKTEIDGFDSPGHARHIGRYTVSEATSFDDRFDLPTTSKNAYGHPTTIEYHPFFGTPVSVTDVNGAGTLTEYDALGRVTKVTDILKGTETITSYTWDSSVTVGPPTGVSGLTLTSAYRAQTTTTVQPTVTAYYDRLGRVLRTVKEGFAGQQTVTDAIYNTLGQVVATSLPYKSGTNPLWTETAYDVLGRVVTATAPNGTVTTNTYKGRVTQVTVDATDRPSQTNATYVDAKGRTIAVWNADNPPATTLLPGSDAAVTADVTTASIEFRLDGFGRMRETRLKGQTQLIFASYDAFGRQESLNDPDKGYWEYVNNALGQVVTQTDAKSTVTNSTFDRLGRPLSRTTTEALNGPVETASWFYYDSVADASRHLVAKGDQGWIGALQREEAVTTGSSGYGASATASVRYYNSKGLPSIDLSLVDGKWFYTATGYDDFSRVSTVQRYWRPAGHESPSSQPYAWDNFGYSYAYDDESYVLNVVDSRGNTWWQADPVSGYDHLDRPVRFRKDTGIWTDRAYRSTDGLLTGIATTAGAVSVQNLVFDYDGLGNLKSRQSGMRSENFEYDPLNRLTLSSISGSTEYFDNGNIRKKTSVSGETTADYVYGSSKPHAVTSAFGYGMTYDANGNLEARTGNGHIWSTRWAGFDKPRWLAKDGKGDEFIYNANRSRVVHLEFDQMSDDQPSHYTKKKIYALGAAVEVDYTNTEAIGASWTMDTVRLYVAAPSGTAGAMEFKPGTTTWKGYVYHHDHLGSIDVITDLESNSGTPADDKASRPARYSYDAWGQRRNADTWTGVPVNTTHGGVDDITPRGFTGHEMMDGLGLVHMNGRIYDPLLGRMLSADVVVDGAGSLQGYNRYSYVANNPLSFTDPSGFTKADPHDNSYLNRSRELSKSDKTSDQLKAIWPGIVGSAIATYDSIFYVGNQMSDQGKEVRAEAWNSIAAMDHPLDAYMRGPTLGLQYVIGAGFEFVGSGTTAIAGTPEHLLDLASPRVKAMGALGDAAQLEGKMEIAAFDMVARTAFDTAIEFKSEIASFLVDNAGEIFYSAISGNPLDSNVSATFEGTNFSTQLNARLDTNFSVISPFDFAGMLSGGNIRNAAVSAAVGAEAPRAKSLVGLTLFGVNVLGSVQGAINDVIEVESEEERKKREESQSR